MIVVNEKLINQTIKTSVGKVTVNKKGEAEVSQEIGEKLIAGHGFYEKGNKPQPKVEAPKEIKTDEEAKTRIAELEQKLLVSGQRLEKAESDLKLSKEEVESWKAEYTKVLIAEGDKNDKKEEVNVAQLQDNEISLIIDLCGKGLNDLGSLCEELTLPKQEWEGLKKKDLVIYLAKKTLYSK